MRVVSLANYWRSIPPSTFPKQMIAALLAQVQLGRFHGYFLGLGAGLACPRFGGWDGVNPLLLRRPQNQGPIWERVFDAGRRDEFWLFYQGLGGR